ncbi:hypothetical protein EIO60_03797|nr:hypothetical protein [Candidatus Pantoea persica]
MPFSNSQEAAEARNASVLSATMGTIKANAEA